MVNPFFSWKSLIDSDIENKYFLKEFLGSGTFGGVFRAEEVLLDRLMREVAIKLILLNGDDDNNLANYQSQKKIDLALNELKMGLKLNHPNLLQVFSTGKLEIHRTLFLYQIMELGKETLQSTMNREKLNTFQIKSILLDIIQGINYLHQQNLIHRDLRPANILLVNGRWKIADYGLIRAVNPNKSHDSTNNYGGTPAYSPPESYDGIISSAFDIWSFGVMTVELCSRRLPYDFQTLNQLQKKVINCELTIPALHSPFKEIVEGCLQQNRGDRLKPAQIINLLNPTPPKPPEPKQIIIQREGMSRRSFLVSLGITSFGAVFLWEFLTSNRDFLGKGNFTETLPNGIQLEMVAIPAGEFMMGSDNGDDDEKPVHKVTLKSFYLGKYEVTQAQYQAIMGENPSHFKGENNPVDQVNWYKAQEFCQKLSEKTGREYRLPSEAQWEYACKAGSISKWSFGDDENQLKDYAWYKENSGSQTHPVGEKKPNKWELYDMHGNVLEWCEDDYHDSYQGAPTDGKAWIENNNHSQDNPRKILRGGSWFYSGYYCRCAFRDGNNAGDGNYGYGFRVMCVAP